MAEKTDRFASEIKKAAQLPKSLQAIYEDALTKYGAARLAIYAPPLDKLSAEDEPYLNGCVLAIFDDYFFIGSEGEVNQAASFEIAFADIICVETGHILLHSWFKLVFGKDVCRHVKIPFNTVGENLFREAIRLIRGKLDTVIEGDFEPKIPTQSDLPLKFLNALHGWLAAGEKIIGFAFQPEIRASHLIVYEEQIAPPSLVALTERQILLIVEEAATARVQLEKYGEIYSYCPTSRFGDAVVSPRESEESLSEFDLMLTNHNARFVIRSIIGAECAPQFNRLSELISERCKEKIK